MSKHINAETAHRVVRAIRRQVDFDKYDNLQVLMEQFSHIRLREGYVLDAFEAGEFLGSNYQLYARPHDAAERVPYMLLLEDAIGREVPLHIATTVPSAFEYIEYEFNKESIWELFLLYISWQYMPLKWHANYARTDYIFDKADLEQLLGKWPLSGGIRRNKDGQEEVVPPGTYTKLGEKVAVYLDDDSILPKVTLLSDCEAEVEICFWNDWKGLARKRVRLRKEATTTTFHYKEYDTEEAKEKESLVPYHCGIVF